jgi:hypothetical protein
MPEGADALVRREQGREQEAVLQVAACHPGRIFARAAAISARAMCCWRRGG